MFTQAGGAVWQALQRPAARAVQPLQGVQISQALWQLPERCAAAQIELPQVRQGAQAVWQVRQAAAACSWSGRQRCEAVCSAGDVTQTHRSG